MLHSQSTAIKTAIADVFGPHPLRFTDRASRHAARRRIRDEVRQRYGFDPSPIAIGRVFTMASARGFRPSAAEPVAA